MKYSLALIYLRHPLTLMCQHSTKDKIKRFQESNIIMLIQKILKKKNCRLKHSKRNKRKWAYEKNSFFFL